MSHDRIPVRFRDLPLVLKVAMAGYLISFVLMSVSISMSGGHPARVFPILLGGFAILIGVLFAGDVRASATLYSQWAARLFHRAYGADMTPRVFAASWFMRAFGMALALVGVVFAAVGFASS